ncbi:MAG: YdcF family protein [Byssovorax sp.]
MSNDEAFTDAADLAIPDGAGLPDILRSLLRGELSGADPGGFVRAYDAAPAAQREEIAHAWADAVDDALAAEIEADPALRRAIEAIVSRVAPRDPSPDHNRASLAALSRFTDWQSFPYGVIIVPGYTPPSSTVAAPGVHATALRRLEQAAADLADGKAPFVIVTGGNVYPRGTRYYEAIEMKAALVELGVAEAQILVEARARHSTTNLRNAGRLMLAHRMGKGLITTVGGGMGGSDVFDQDFYFSHPALSTFYARCVSELGYRVGELRGAGEGHTEFTPAHEITRVGIRDALDP